MTVFMNILCTYVFPETFDSEEDQLKHDLLHGGYNLNDLPKVPSNVVKLYVCASRKGALKIITNQIYNLQLTKMSIVTFKMYFFFTLDFEKERDILIKEVYPDLRQYCRDNYGVDFHVSSINFIYVN